MPATLAGLLVVQVVPADVDDGIGPSLGGGADRIVREVLGRGQLDRLVDDRAAFGVEAPGPFPPVTQRAGVMQRPDRLLFRLAVTDLGFGPGPPLGQRVDGVRWRCCRRKRGR